MNNEYTIIIPIYNETRFIPRLLIELEIYHKNGNEILIIDDGSDDGGDIILKNCPFIRLISFQKNTWCNNTIKCVILYLDEIQ